MLQNKHKIAVLLACCFATLSNAQPSIQWEKSFGGTSAEAAIKIIQTPDGGYLISSLSRSNNGDVTGNHGNNDLWLLKINSNGQKQWQKCLGGIDADAVAGMDNVATGGYILVGNTLSNGDKSSSEVYGNHGNQDIWVVKVDGNGTLEWRQCYGGCDREEARSIIQTNDGNFVVAGGTQSYNSGDVYGSHSGWDAWAIKIAPNGNVVWQKTLGGSSVDYLYDVAETTGGKLVFAGLSSSGDGDLSGTNHHGEEDYWVVQLSSDGNLLWGKTYGGVTYDGARSLIIDSNEDILVAGATYSNDGDVSGSHGQSDVWVLRLSNTGDLIWQSALGGTSSEAAFQIFKRSDNDFILAGETSSADADVVGNHGGLDAWIIKMDKDGYLKSQICLGGTDNDFARAATQGAGDEIVVAATAASSDGDVSQHLGETDTWVVKLSVPLGLKPEAPSAESQKLTVIPNPAKDIIQVTTTMKGSKAVTIFDAGGKMLQTVLMESMEQDLNIQSLPAGHYQIRLQTTKGEVLSTKFCKM